MSSEENKSNQASESANGQVYTLTRTFEFEGKTYEELTLDFDKLTGDDLLSCENELNATISEGTFIPMKEIDKRYLALVVAKAAGVPSELIRKLPAKDFSKVTVRAQNFLLI